MIPYRSANRIEGVVLTFIDVTSLTKAEAHQRLLIAELQHRTRNLLAVIQSIANQTLGTSDSLEAFRESFNQRLAALSRVQGLLSTSRAQPIIIGTLVRMELDALNALRDGKQVVLEGPEIALPESMIRTLAGAARACRQRLQAWRAGIRARLAYDHLGRRGSAKGTA